MSSKVVYLQLHHLLDEVTFNAYDSFDDLLLRVFGAPTEGEKRYEMVLLQHLHTDHRTPLGLFEDAAELSGLWGIRDNFPRPDGSYLLEYVKKKARKVSRVLRVRCFF